MSQTPITLYDTRTRTKQPLVPLDPANVRMYVCGPTVYDRAHIGNARPVVVFDTLFRLLRHTYGEANVTYVRNLTDVDDKINKRAADTLLPGETELQAIRRITDETIGWYHADMHALGALRPTREPRATEFIPAMVAMIETLIARGNAYPAEGHVLFAVATDPDYGLFSRRSVEDMRAGARVEVAPYKRDPMDFVLWKPSTPDQPGWDSPWGRGRPGWHIECSAMSYELLGASFDIHGGGIDLVFPHHENEIAQSRCAHPEGSFANIWMHNGFVNVEGEKMSKSLGNFFTVRDLLSKRVPGEVIRFVLLNTHYRQPMDFTESKIDQARTVLSRWRRMTEGVSPASHPAAKVTDALSDDLNTPRALAALHEMENAPDVLMASAQILGLLWPELGGWYNQQYGATGEFIVKRLVAERVKAKQDRNFALADAIRSKLAEVGVTISDSPKGATFRMDDMGAFVWFDSLSPREREVILPDARQGVSVSDKPIVEAYIKAHLSEYMEALTSSEPQSLENADQAKLSEIPE